MCFARTGRSFAHRCRRRNHAAGRRRSTPCGRYARVSAARAVPQTSAFTNRLIDSNDPYFAAARAQSGERTIYSNPEIAKLMNQWFINIKVDREQRPDLDSIYMLATELITRSGGWANNVFLTPDLKPLYAGSYFAPQDDGGPPGFPTILQALHAAWVRPPPGCTAASRSLGT